jgi:putative restriction endonuclease
MASLLSIRTVFPRQGGRVWYDDQRDAHRQIYEGDDIVEYAFMGTDPNAPDNRWLRDAMDRQIPVIYFLGTSPGHYQPIIPTFIVGWHPERLRVQLAFGAIVGASVEATPPSAPERRYALREIKARLHQASFRDAVLAAYDGRCAISKLPETRLLDAAHIVIDAHEQLGQPIVSNGLPLTKIHHAAFDANLIGHRCGLPHSCRRSAARHPRRPLPRIGPQEYRSPPNWDAASPGRLARSGSASAEIRGIPEFCVRAREHVFWDRKDWREIQHQIS